VGYYSTYFRIYFLTSTAIILDEDRIEDFEIIFNYMRYASYEIEVPYEDDIHKSMTYCMHVIEYGAKYSLEAASCCIFDAVEELLSGNVAERELLQPSYIKLVFGRFPEGHRMRALFGKMASKMGFDEGRFEIQEREVDGFASEVLKQGGMGNPVEVVVSSQ
jgi:hypothetical protein